MSTPTLVYCLWYKQLEWPYTGLGFITKEVALPHVRGQGTTLQRMIELEVNMCSEIKANFLPALSLSLSLSLSHSLSLSLSLPPSLYTAHLFR